MIIILLGKSVAKYREVYILDKKYYVLFVAKNL